MDNQNLSPEKKPLSKKQKIIRYILRDMIIFAVAAAMIWVCNLVFGGSCYTKVLFDFDCPFCGMTRAHFAALRLDFAAAFGFHRLFFLGVPYLYLLTHEELFRGKRQKPYFVTVIIMTAALLINYGADLVIKYLI